MSTIYIEISGGCNAKCPYCARQRFKERYCGKNMSPDLFEKIIDHLIDNKLINKERTIGLFNWGDPFLNPKINDILKILKKNNLFGVISSNFIKTPKIDNENLHILNQVTLSLSGFSAESYSKIHGANLNSVLDHFEKFHEQIRKYTPKTLINISWHRYRFNEREFWDAYKYCVRLGIKFYPSLAYLNDGLELLSYVEGSLSDERQSVAEKDLFLDDLKKMISYHAKSSKGYNCHLQDDLVIDEMGQLLLCCSVTNEDHDCVLGNILQMSVDDILKKKVSHPRCNRCIRSGIPKWFGSTKISKPFPFEFTTDYFKVRKLYAIYFFIGKVSKFTKLIKKSTKGETFINWIKAFFLSN